MSNRSLLGAGALVAIVIATSAISFSADAHSPGMPGQSYGWGMMGPGMMRGWGYGPGMMGGYGPGYGHGPGYMMGPDGGYHNYGRAPGYRGQRLCWKETDGRNYGHYEPCRS